MDKTNDQIADALAQEIIGKDLKDAKHQLVQFFRQLWYILEQELQTQMQLVAVVNKDGKVTKVLGWFNPFKVKLA